MDEKNRLVDLKYSATFALVQREIQEKRKELAERFGMRNMLHSGSHARAIVELEFSGLKKLLDSKLQAILEVYYKNLIPWTENDEIFIKGEIEELFNARFRISRESLLDYFNQRRIPSLIDYFERDATSIFSDIKSRIKIIIIENRISYPELPDLDVEQLLKMDESNQLEFKSTFQWDIKSQTKNEKLRFEVISTIAAFNNTDGGYLLIGVQDDKSIFSLEKDYSSLKDKKDRDGFNLLLTQEIENKISRSFLPGIQISFHNIENKDICLIKTDIGDDAIWLKENNQEMFYIRTQNSTRALSPKESAEYIRKKWRPKG
jgi:hypothetical protein